MPYSTSSARGFAIKRLGELRSPFEYAKSPVNGLPNVIAQSIYQNTVFQISASIEDYIRDLTSTWFANLISKKAKISALPEATRLLLVAKANEEAFKRYFALKDESDLVERIKQNKSVFSLLLETNLIPTLEFQESLINRKKFPSAKNIETLFRRLGLPKMNVSIAKHIKGDFELSLKSFMDIRNALAHESPPDITDVDVDKYLSQAELWIEAIDSKFYEHVTSVSGEKYWHS